MTSLKTEFQQNFYFNEKVLLWVTIPLLFLLATAFAFSDLYVDPILEEYSPYVVHDSKGFDYSLILVMANIGAILFLNFSIVLLSFVTALAKKYNISTYQKIRQFTISFKTAFLMTKKFTTDDISQIEKIHRILSESIKHEKESKIWKSKYFKLEKENKELKDKQSNNDNSND